jgi:antitoxin component YwqK of YwqJK toxin-antitoxin module
MPGGMKKILVCLLFIAPVLSFAQQERKVTLLEDKNLYQVVYYHDNGVVSQEGTINLQGQLHGSWVSFSETGEKVAMGNYLNGKKDGKWFFWNEGVLSEVDYDLNHIASVQQWKEGSRLALNQ